MLESSITLPDGRVLSYAEVGNPDGAPLIFCHGTPGSRLELSDDDFFVRITDARVIIPDRPGYGGSTPRPERTLSDHGYDVDHLANALEINQFIVVGGSGGGPHALACAHAMPNRVLACLVYGSPSPCDFPGATDGMIPANSIGLRFSERGGWFYRQMIRMSAKVMLRQPEASLRAVARAADPSDASILLSPEYLDIWHRTVREAFRQGSDGHAVDARLILTKRPWSFSLEEIRVPVYIWHGEQDRFIGPAMGRRLAEKIPGAELFMLPNLGCMVSDHVATAQHMARVIDQHWSQATAPAPPGQSD